MTAAVRPKVEDSGAIDKDATEALHRQLFFPAETDTEAGPTTASAWLF